MHFDCSSEHYHLTPMLQAFPSKSFGLQSLGVESSARRVRAGPRDRERDLGGSDLPPGWQLCVKTHRSGASKGNSYKEIFSPEGQRYLSYNAVRS